MKIKIISIFLILIVSITFSCNKQQSVWKGTIQKKDGVIVVNNPKEPMYGPEILSLEEDLSIRGSRTDNAAHFSLVSDINVDQEGRIYVLDSMESCLFIFDGCGSLIKTIGGEGQGPGELQGPSRIYFSSQNEIVIQDMQRLRLNYYSLDGGFLQAKHVPFTLIGLGSLFDTDGNLVGLVFTRKDGKDAQELRKIDPSFNEILSITHLFDPPRGTLVIGSPSIYWRLMPNDHILFSDSSEYEIKMVNPEGTLIKTIIRKFNPVEFTDEEKESWLKNQNSGITYKFAKYRSPIRWLLPSDQGYFIVGTWEKTETGDNNYYDIFDPEGRYLTKIQLKFQPPRVWKKDKMYFIAEDEDGFQTVTRYKVTWTY